MSDDIKDTEIWESRCERADELAKRLQRLFTDPSITWVEAVELAIEVLEKEVGDADRA